MMRLMESHHDLISLFEHDLRANALRLSRGNPASTLRSSPRACFSGSCSSSTQRQCQNKKTPVFRGLFFVRIPTLRGKRNACAVAYHIPKYRAKRSQTEAYLGGIMSTTAIPTTPSIAEGKYFRWLQL